jgi:hypothetical protein
MRQVRGYKRNTSTMRISRPEPKEGELRAHRVFEGSRGGRAFTRARFCHNT